MVRSPSSSSRCRTLRAEARQVAGRKRRQEGTRAAGGDDAGVDRRRDPGGDLGHHLAARQPESRTQQRRYRLAHGALDGVDIATVQVPQAAQVQEHGPVGAQLDGRADPLQLGDDLVEHARDAHRIGLEDDRLGAERDDLAEQQAGPDAGCLSLGRAQVDHFALARRAAEDERQAVPGGVAEHLDPQRQVRQPDAGDADVWPGVSGHAALSLERLF